MIYIDDSKNPYLGMIMSHVAADSLKELHSFADSTGIGKHFQDKKDKPHYDICQQKKKLAIQQLKAVEIPKREFIARVKSMTINCHKCKDRGWFFVNEWIGTLQGRQDCNCDSVNYLI